jgi:predicted CopG family antitoxin
MGTATDQIRISSTVKRELIRRKREDESYNDVLERVLGETSDPDFYDGFGSLSDEQADAIRETREKGKQKSNDRMQRLSGGNQ